MSKIFYYKDELSDDFGTTVKKIRPLPEKYKYISKNPFERAISFILYYLIAKPFAWLYVKIKFKHKFVGKRIVKNLKSGYFIYGNHTTLIGDAFIPSLISYPIKNYIITGEQTRSLKAILPLLRALGSIPLSDSVSQNIDMLRCVKQRIWQGSSITIYPEAHVWPYYTKIRPYSEKSFYYAVSSNAPVICMTTCFQKKKLGKKPKIVTYIDGPFYPNKLLKSSLAAKELRDSVYDTMKKRAEEFSTYKYFEYKRLEDSNGKD